MASIKGEKSRSWLSLLIIVAILGALGWFLGDLFFPVYRWLHVDFAALSVEHKIPQYELETPQQVTIRYDKRLRKANQSVVMRTDSTAQELRADRRFRRVRAGRKSQNDWLSERPSYPRHKCRCRPPYNKCRLIWRQIRRRRQKARRVHRGARGSPRG